MNSYEELFSVHRTQRNNRLTTESTTTANPRAEGEMNELQVADPRQIKSQNPKITIRGKTES